MMDYYKFFLILTYLVFYFPLNIICVGSFSNKTLTYPLKTKFSTLTFQENELEKSYKHDLGLTHTAPDNKTNEAEIVKTNTISPHIFDTKEVPRNISYNEDEVEVEKSSLTTNVQNASINYSLLDVFQTPNTGKSDVINLPITQKKLLISDKLHNRNDSAVFIPETIIKYAIFNSSEEKIDNEDLADLGIFVNKSLTSKEVSNIISPNNSFSLPANTTTNVTNSENSLNRTDFEDLGILVNKTSEANTIVNDIKLVNSGNTKKPNQTMNCENKKNDCKITLFDEQVEADDNDIFLLSNFTDISNSFTERLDFSPTNKSKKPLQKEINQKIKRYNGTVNLTLYLNCFRESFKYNLKILESIPFSTNAYLWIESSESFKSELLSTILKDLEIYEGSIEGNVDSYAIGYIADETFIGAVMLPNGNTIYIESSEKFQHINNSAVESFLTYVSSDVGLNNCLKRKSSNDLSCEGSFVESYSCKYGHRKEVYCFFGLTKIRSQFPATSSPLNVFNESLLSPPDTSFARDVTCIIELVSDPSHFVGVHNMNLFSAMREMILIVLQANYIFSHLDMDGDGEPDNLRLSIGRIVLQYSKSLTSGQETMEQYISKLRKRVPEHCMSILFVSNNQTEEPVSYTYEGGICKNNDIESEYATNIAVVNTQNPEKSTLLAKTWILTKTIGQLMGSSKVKCDLEANTTSDNWQMYFSECEKRNMAKFLRSEGNCLLKNERFVHRNLKKNETKESNGDGICGDGKVDANEECDCGSIETCNTKSSCCVPPGRENECTFDKNKGYECEWTDICCTRDCKLIPETWELFCGYGEPSCSPKLSYCNGVSSKCPVPNIASSVLNGQICWPGASKHEGASTCKNGFCNSTICQDAGLVDCKCDKNGGEECRVCCKKSSKDDVCVPAEHFGLRSKSSKFFYRHAGTSCREVRFGKCNNVGICSQSNFVYSSACKTLLLSTEYIGIDYYTFIFVYCSVILRIIFLRLF